MNKGTQPAAGGESEEELIANLNAALEGYEIISLLGRGGMGAVYKARQISLDRLVAIKVLASQLISEEDSMEFGSRFQREAKAMAHLNHANIISVYDFGSTSAGEFYIVMEYIEGTDLHTLLQAGGLTTDHVNGWISQICEALQYAHSREVVHRDIKPANIMITTEGEVKIADFGLAKLTGPEHDEPSLTMTNVAMGTPDYVAPEALDATAEVDHRADLYALGVMLYEMLTGKVPRGAWKSPTELVEGLDSRYENLVLRAMDSDPAGRYQQATEIRSAIYDISSSPDTAGKEEVQLGQGRSPSSRVSFSDISKFEEMPEAPKPKPKQKSPAVAILGVGLFSALLIGVLGWLFLGRNSSQTTTVSQASSDPIAAAGLRAQPAPESKSEPETEPKPEPKPGPEAEQKPDSDTAGPKVAAAPSSTEEPLSSSQSGKTAPDAETSPVEIAKPVGTETGEETASRADEMVESPAPEALTKQEPEIEDSTGTGSPEEEMAATPKTDSPLSGLAALDRRLSVYLRERRSRVGTLAAQYLRGVEARVDRAANSGQLALTNAFRDEQARVEQLQAALAQTPDDLLQAATNPVALPPLAESSPDELVSLRETWTAEREKIRGDLNAKLDLSLRNLEAELTRARDFDRANALLAWRENLLTVAGTPEESIREPQPSETASTPSSSMTGPLRGYSSVENDHPPLDVSEAERYSDFKSAQLITSGGWAAVRENGTVVSNMEKYDRLRNVRKLLKGGFVLFEDGTLENPMREEVEPLRKVVDASSGHLGGIAVNEDGEIEIFGEAELPPEPIPSPRIISTMWESKNGSVAIDEEGNLHKWGEHDWVASLSPDSPSEIVEIKAGWHGFLVLRENGRVEQWPGGAVPANLPPFRRIEAEGMINAGQTEDLRWHAWGDSYGGAVDKINEIGPAVDINFAVNGRGWAYVIWIPIETEE